MRIDTVKDHNLHSDAAFLMRNILIAKNNLFLRGILILLLTLFIANSLMAKTASILVVKRPNIEIYELGLSGFIEALNEKGLVEGVNFTLDKIDLEQVKDIPAPRLKTYDLIYAVGTEAAKIMKETAVAAPIVFSMVLDPVGGGLVKSLSVPGANITGSSLILPIRMELEKFKTVLPNAKRIGILYNPGNSQSIIDEIQKLQSFFNIELIAISVSQATEVPTLLGSLKNKEIDVLWLLVDNIIYTKDTLPLILQFGINNKVPVIGFALYLSKAGALISYVFDYKDIGKQAGEIAASILSGELPANLPITVPRKINSILNLKIAKYLKIEFSDKMRDSAFGVLE